MYIRRIANPAHFSFIGILFLAQLASAGSRDSVLVLEEVLQKALQQNPGLQSVEFAAKAADRRIAQSGSLPDPQLTVGVMSLPVDSYKFNQEPMTQKVIGIAQAIPFPGKLGFKEDIASREHQMRVEQVQHSRLLLINQVKNTYFRIAFLKNAAELVDKNRILLEDLVEITRTRYAVGKGLQQDILKGQVQVLQEEQRILELRELYQNAEADLNILLNQMPQQPLPPPVQLPVMRLDKDLKTLQETAIENNPTLKILMHDIDRSKSQVSLAKRDYWPDFKLSVTYGQREQRPDFLGAQIGLNIPLYSGSRQSQRVEETQLLTKKSLSSFENEKLSLLRDVKNVRDETEKNQQLIRLYNDNIIPRAEQALQSSVAAYQNDRVDFLTVINNQMTLLSQQLKLEQLIRDFHQNIAELEFICGTSIQ